MKLSVKDVAEILSVSEKTIYRMIQSESIPCVRIGGQWRFDRMDIMSWLEDKRCLACGTPVPAAGRRVEMGAPVSISSLIRRGGVFTDLPGQSREAAVHCCLQEISARVPSLEGADLFGSVMEREDLCPTAIGHGIAMPHPKEPVSLAWGACVSLCRLHGRVPFGPSDNDEVDTLFYIFYSSRRHLLRTQSRLMRLLWDDEVREAVTGALATEVLLRIISRKEAEIFGSEVRFSAAS